MIAYRVSKQLMERIDPKDKSKQREVQQDNIYQFNEVGKITGVSIRYILLDGDIYNSVSVTRVPYGPINPQFISDSPIIYPVSILYEGLQFIPILLRFILI